MLKYLLLILFVSSLRFSSNAQNGKISTRINYDILKDSSLANRVFDKKNGKLKDSYNYLKEVKVEELLYESDGLKIKAYLVSPKKIGVYPAIIYNRGGNRDFGSLNSFKIAFILARLASQGYVVIGSQYRGTDGGEGMEEFGGKDVNDILSLIPLLNNETNVEKNNLGMYGWSRGGMMTFLSLMKTTKIKAAAVGGAATDLRLMNASRGGEMEKYVYAELIPNYYEKKDSLLADRSVITRVDEICKTTPVLLMHGTSDWRVIPEESLYMAKALQKSKIPYRLIMFEGGDHGLTEFKEEVNSMVIDWFNKYLKKKIPLPNLEKHGK